MDDMHASRIFCLFTGCFDRVCSLFSNFLGPVNMNELSIRSHGGFTPKNLPVKWAAKEIKNPEPAREEVLTNLSNRKAME